MLPRPASRPESANNADLELDLDTHQVWRAGEILPVPPTGFKLLRVLMETAPRVVTFNKLEACLWGQNHELSESNLRVQIYKLRRLIDRPFDPSLIQTKRSVG